MIGAGGRTSRILRPREVSKKDLLRFAVLMTLALGLVFWMLIEPPLSADERALAGRWYVARPGVARILEFGSDRRLRTESRPYVRLDPEQNIPADGMAVPASPATAGRLPIEAVGTWRSERGFLHTRSWFPQNDRSLFRKLLDLVEHRRWSGTAVTEATFRCRCVDADEIELEVLPGGGKIRAVRVPDDFEFPERLLSVEDVKVLARAPSPTIGATP